MSAPEGTPAGVVIDEWRPDRDEPSSVERDLAALAEILRAAVYEGAGVSFFVPFTVGEARAFWVDKVVPSVRARTRRVLVAREDGHIVGTVQVDLALPPNQQHRAEVAKMLVHPGARRQGIGEALMRAVEELARTEGRSLLTLDTVTGSRAERLYARLGYVTVGVIPRFARQSLTPELEAATLMYKELGTRPAD